MRTATVELSKATLFYRDAGKGHPAVFVHALLTDSRTWLDQLDGLGDRSRMLAPDLSGQGFSSPMRREKVSSDYYADELLEFLDALKLREPVDVVGLSGGGMIAAIACARRPERCRSLVLISTVFNDSATDAAGVRYRAENARTVVIEGKDTLFRRFNEYIVAPGASLTARARYRTMLEQTPYEQFVAFLTTAEQVPRSQLPAQLKLPVMIPVGRGDSVLTPAMAEQTAKLIPRRARRDSAERGAAVAARGAGGVQRCTASILGRTRCQRRQAMITLKQRGRSGLQFLGSLQQFSSSVLRDHAEADFAAQPEAEALTEEFKTDVRPHVWRERLDRARDVVERSKAYRYNRFYQRFVAEQNYVRAIPAVEARRQEWETVAAAKQPKDESRLKLDPNLPIPRWYEGVEWHLEPGGWDGYDLVMPMFMAGHRSVRVLARRLCGGRRQLRHPLPAQERAVRVPSPRLQAHLRSRLRRCHDARRCPAAVPAGRADRRRPLGGAAQERPFRQRDDGHRHHVPAGRRGQGRRGRRQRRRGDQLRGAPRDAARASARR